VCGLTGGNSGGWFEGGVCDLFIWFMLFVLWVVEAKGEQKVQVHLTR